jgi:hypothetical protein
MRRIAALAIGILFVAAPSAEAKWFGANLGRQANSQASCQSFIYFQQVPSCSWTTSGAIFNPAEGMVVPGTGTITQVKIKVGPQPGPMRAAILESLRSENSGEAACCLGRRQTKVLTQKPNTTRTYNVNLPVSVTYNKKSHIYAYDSLFLTMEDPNTPIPANADGNTDSGNCSGGWFPAVRPKQENYSGPYGVCGYTILIRGNWQRKK